MIDDTHGLVMIRVLWQGARRALLRSWPVSQRSERDGSP